MELAIDPQKPVPSAMPRTKSTDEYCSMCGDYCAVKIIGEYLDDKKRKTLKSIGKRPISTLLPFPKTSKGLAEHFLFGKPFS